MRRPQLLAPSERLSVSGLCGSFGRLGGWPHKVEVWKRCYKASWGTVPLRVSQMAAQTLGPFLAELECALSILSFWAQGRRLLGTMSIHFCRQAPCHKGEEAGPQPRLPPTPEGRSSPGLTRSCLPSRCALLPQLLLAGQKLQVAPLGSSGPD